MKNKQKTPCFASSLKGASAFSGFAPFRVGANKGRKCDFLVMLNSYVALYFLLRERRLFAPFPLF